MVEAAFKEGLEDVVAGESSICYIDGNKGVLSYRGFNIHTLAANASFEETAYLLWYGTLPNRRQLAELREQLAAERKLPAPVVKFLRDLPHGVTPSVPMDVLRTGVSMLSHYDADATDMSDAANQRKAIRLTAQIATLVACFDRLRNGRETVEASPSASHAAAFLEMLTGQAPGPNAERAMDVALVLHADHELNASTFAARVTAATLSDVHSAVVSGIGTLKGPLHGGANEAVMKLLLQFPDEQAALAGVKQMLANKKKISGFGHRVYHTEDPRATHLRKMSEALGRETGDLKWFRISEAVENYIKREKGLNANVDFYSASTYYVLGIPIDLYTPIFAVSRISGWTAHVLEQLRHNRLIRPRAEYIGPPDGQAWVPLANRG
jgi:citrate synthase